MRNTNPQISLEHLHARRFEQYKSIDPVEHLNVRICHKEENTREGKGLVLKLYKIVLLDQKNKHNI